MGNVRLGVGLVFYHDRHKVGMTKQSRIKDPTQQQPHPPKHQRLSVFSRATDRSFKELVLLVCSRILIACAAVPLSDDV